MAQRLYAAGPADPDPQASPSVDELHAALQLIADTARIVGPGQALHRNAGFRIAQRRTAGDRQLADAVNDAIRIVCRWRQHRRADGLPLAPPPPPDSW